MILFMKWIVNSIIYQLIKVELSDSRVKEYNRKIEKKCKGHALLKAIEEIIYNCLLVKII
jgi:hypothetical protein